MMRTRSVLLVAPLVLWLGLAIMHFRRSASTELIDPMANSAQEQTSAPAPTNRTSTTTEASSSQPTLRRKETGDLSSLLDRDLPIAVKESPKGIVIAKGSSAIKERDGGFHFNSGSYGASVTSSGISVGSAISARGIGRGLLSYSLEEVRVAGALVALGGDLAPTRSANADVVSYRRGSVEERYTLRENALEQDFIFTDLPEGRGEIIVTGTVRTNLVAPEDGTKGPRLSFTHMGQEVLSIHDAVVIDADGKRLQLELAYSDSKLMVSIPANWVAKATLPIVLDPIIGTPINVHTAPGQILGRTVCNSTTGQYLVAWHEVVGASNHDIFVQSISASGELIGLPVLVGSDRLPPTASLEFYVALQYAATLDRFLLVWQSYPGQSGDTYAIVGRILDGAGVPVQGPFDIQVDHSPNGQVGLGDSAIVFNGIDKWLVAHTHAFVVYYPPYGGNVWISSVRLNWVSSSGQVTSEVPPMPDSQGEYSNYRASLAVEAGRLLIAWVHESRETGYDSLRAYTMDATGAQLTPQITVTEGTQQGSTLSYPSAEGGAGKFLVTYKQSPSDGITGVFIDASTGETSSPLFTVASPVPPSPHVFEAKASFSPADQAWNVGYLQQDPFALFTTRVVSAVQVGPAELLSNDFLNASWLSIARNPVSGEFLYSYATQESGSPNTWHMRALRYQYVIPPPPAPTGLIATAQDSRVNLTWTASPGATVYYVKRALSLAGPFDSLGETDVTLMVDEDVSNGVSYCYLVLARNLGGDSPNSDPAFCTPMATTSFPALFVVGNTNLSAADTAIKTRLENLGYVFPPGSVVKDSNSAATQATGKAIVVISASISPTGTPNVGQKFVGVSVPVLVCESAILDDMKMTGVTANQHFGTENTETTLNIVAAPHALTAGYPNGNLPVCSSSTFSWGKPLLSPGSEAIVIAKLVSQDVERVGVFAYETGSKMVNPIQTPFLAPARRVGFFLESTTAGNLNNDGKNLFDAAIRWAVNAPSAVGQLSSFLLPNGAIQLWWSASDGASSYRVRRSLSIGGPYTLVADGITGTSFVDSDVQPNTTYYYTLEPIGVNGFGPAGGVLTVPPLAGTKAWPAGRPYIRALPVGQGAADLWNTATIDFPLWGPGGAQGGNNNTSSLTVPFVLNGSCTPAKVNEVKWTVATNPGNFADLPLTYAVTATNGDPVGKEFKIRVKKRQVLKLRFKFPEVPDKPIAQCNRVPNLFEVDGLLRETARKQVCAPFQQALSIWNHPMNGLVLPTEPGLEQACVDIYSEIDLIPPGDPAYRIKKDYFDNNGKFIIGEVQEDGSSPTGPEAMDVEDKLGSLTEICIYFVKGLTITNDPDEVLGSAMFKVQPKNNRTVFIADNAGTRTLLHELAHVLGLKLHTNKAAINLHPLTALMNNPWHYTPLGNAPGDRYNLMWATTNTRLSSHLVENQCDIIYQTSAIHVARDAMRSD